MRQLQISFVTLVAFGLGACATTGASSPKTNIPTFTDAMAKNFVDDIDGAAIHPGSGFRCPADIDGLPRARAELSQADGSDLFCHYIGEAERLSLFLTSVPQMMSEEDYFAAGYVGMKQAMNQDGFEIDETATKLCDDAAGSAPMMRSMMSQLLSGSGGTNEVNKTIEVSPAAREVLVMTKAEMTSLMIFDEVTPGLWLKLRYTGVTKPAADSEEESATCAQAVKIFDAREAEIRKSAGLTSDLERILAGTEEAS